MSNPLANESTGLTDIALFSERMRLDIGRFTTDVPAADWNRMFGAGIRQAAAHFFDASERRRDLLEFRVSLLQVLDTSDYMIM